MNSLAIIVFTAIIACAFSASTHAPDSNPVKQQLLASSKKCASDHKLPKDQIKIMFNQDLPKDEKERCFLECMFASVNVVKDGEFSPEGSNKLASIRFKGQEKELADKLIAICAKEIKKGNEKCSLGRKVRECFARNGKTVNFFPSA